MGAFLLFLLSGIAVMAAFLTLVGVLPLIQLPGDAQAIEILLLLLIAAVLLSSSLIVAYLNVVRRTIEKAEGRLAKRIGPADPS
jgi:Na+/melibiose symporter-like transporter